VRVTFTALVPLGAVLLGTGVLVAAGAQVPQFRTSTDLIVLETTVVGRDGTPVGDLRPEEFQVTIDGRRRPVVSADFVQLAVAPAAAQGGRSQPQTSREPPPASLPAPAGDGRLIVIAVDEHSFPAGAQASAREAASRIVDRASPGDALALVAMPGPLTVGPTRDHAAIRSAVSGIGGKRVDAPRSRFNLAASEAVVLKSRSSVAVSEIIGRECRSVVVDPQCRQEVLEAGSIIADALERQGILTIDGLHGVLDNLEGVPGRKNLFVISAGLPTTNQAGGRPNLTAETQRLARRAAAVNVNLYVLYVNIRFMQHFSAATGWRSPSALYEDITMFASGLERFADSAGGGFFQVEVDADPFVDRAFRETSAVYLVGVRPESSESDGKDHQIRVTVTRRGLTVRFRRFVVIPA
jgi:VWFA-related protein